MMGKLLTYILEKQNPWYLNLTSMIKPLCEDHPYNTVVPIHVFLSTCDELC